MKQAMDISTDVRKDSNDSHNDLGGGKNNNKTALIMVK